MFRQILNLKLDSGMIKTFGDIGVEFVYFAPGKDMDLVGGGGPREIFNGLNHVSP